MGVDELTESFGALRTTRRPNGVIITAMPTRRAEVYTTTPVPRRARPGPSCGGGASLVVTFIFFLFFHIPCFICSARVPVVFVPPNDYHHRHHRHYHRSDNNNTNAVYHAVRDLLRPTTKTENMHVKAVVLGTTLWRLLCFTPAEREKYAPGFIPRFRAKSIYFFFTQCTAPRCNNMLLFEFSYCVNKEMLAMH